MGERIVLIYDIECISDILIVSAANFFMGGNRVGSPQITLEGIH